MSNISNRIEETICEFEKIDSWEDRYALLISNGKKMKAMPESQKIEANKVKGCQSQVWLSAEFDGDKVYFSGDSDASIVKGIVSLLLNIYSGSTPVEILTTKPDFIEKIGLKQHLSMSRANGLNSMIKQIMIYAMAFQAKGQLS